MNNKKQYKWNYKRNKKKMKGMIQWWRPMKGTKWVIQWWWKEQKGQKEQNKQYNDNKRNDTMTNDTKEDKRDKRNKTSNTTTMKGMIKQYNNQQYRGWQKGQRNKTSNTTMMKGTKGTKGTKRAIQQWQQEWYNDQQYQGWQNGWKEQNKLYNDNKRNDTMIQDRENTMIVLQKEAISLQNKQYEDTKIRIQTKNTRMNMTENKQNMQ